MEGRGPRRGDAFADHRSLPFDVCRCSRRLGWSQEPPYLSLVGDGAGWDAALEAAKSPDRLADQTNGGVGLNLAVPSERIAVGVVVERRKSTSRWIDFVWQPVGVLPGMPDAAPWTVLSTSSDRTTYYAGPAEVALYRTDTAQYRDNLTSGAPSLWVVLRPTGVDPAIELLAVTADPAEGESFTQAGDDIVEAVT